MSKEDKKEKKNSNTKKGAMLAFGLATIGSRLISAVSLLAIALSFCSLNKEAKVFNNCVEEIRETGKSTAYAVNLCNGGR